MLFIVCVCPHLNVMNNFVVILLHYQFLKKIQGLNKKSFTNPVSVNAPLYKSLSNIILLFKQSNN